MEICYDRDQLEKYLATEAVTLGLDRAPADGERQQVLLLDRFLENAIEIDVDALCDGETVHIGAVMQHVEEAGVHSGDSACVIPAMSPRRRDAYETICAHTEQLALELGVIGLINIQYAVAGDELYVIEANPRASRTVPFVSKAIGRVAGEGRLPPDARREARRHRPAEGRHGARHRSRRPCCRSRASPAPTRCSGPR